MVAMGLCCYGRVFSSCMCSAAVLLSTALTEIQLKASVCVDFIVVYDCIMMRLRLFYQPLHYGSLKTVIIGHV